MGTTLYPPYIRELSGIRFFAAFWVVLYHLRGYIDADLALYTAVVENGPRAVDLFFILSGFILSHVYLPQIEAGQFHFTSFIRGRFARLYPLHLAMLTAFAVAIGASAAVGIGVNQAFPIEDLAAHLLMVQGWGVVEHLSWNGPSWSISAEWFAYLVFPVTAVLLVRAARAPLALTVAAVVIFAVLSWWLGITARTWNVSILRIMPEFVLGGAIFLVGRRYSLPPAWVPHLTVGALLGLVGAAHYDCHDTWLVIASALLIYLLAELSKGKTGTALRNPALVYLGEISYAIYMVHAFVFLAFFKLATLAGWSGWWLPVAVLPLVLLSAMLAYHLIEMPGRRYLRRTEAPLAKTT